jgi:hypothetical protein
MSVAMVMQALIRKIKSVMIIKRMNKEGKQIQERIAKELQAKRYVTIDL